MAKRVKTIVSGRVIEIYSYPHIHGFMPTKARKEKQNLSDMGKKQINKDNSTRYFTRLINANFAKNDSHLVLTYQEEPDGRQTANQCLRKYFKRLRPFLQGKGIDLKYVAVTEQGHTGGRLHHHIVINVSFKWLKELRQLWSKWGNIENGEHTESRIGLISLDGGGDYGELARYLMKERIGAEGQEQYRGKRYFRSQNLSPPKIFNDIVPEEKEIVLPKGTGNIEMQFFGNEYGKFSMLRGILPESLAVGIAEIMEQEKRTNRGKRRRGA